MSKVLHGSEHLCVNRFIWRLKKINLVHEVLLKFFKDILLGAESMSGFGVYASKGRVLFRLLFPSTILRCIVLALLVIACAASAITANARSELAAIIAVITFINLALLCALTIPMQMVALASSRTTIFLGNARNLLLVFLLMFSLGTSLMMCWLWDLSTLNRYSPLMLLGVWLTTSLFLQASVWFSYRWSGAHLFLLVFYLILDDVVSLLELWNPLLLASVLLLSWMAFAYWWINWMPEKYKVNIFFIGLAAHQKISLTQRGNSWFHTGTAHSWLGSRLLGAADGWGVRGRRMLSVLIFTPLGFIPAFLIMDDAQFKGLVHTILLISSATVALGVLANQAFNLRRIWLYSAGDRSEFYSLLQKKFWLDVVPFTLFFSAVAFNLDWLWEAQRGAESWLYFLVSVFLLQSLAFHVYWWVYQRTSASLFWCNLVCFGMVLCWLFMSFATGFLATLPFGWQNVSPLWIVVPELILLVFLQERVRSGFCRVNFAGGSR